MKRIIIHIPSLLLLLCTGSNSLAQDSETKAIMGIIGYDISSEAMVDFCEKNASKELGLRAKWKIWQTKFRIKEIEQKIGPQRNGEIRDSLKSLYNTSYNKTASLGNASATCPQIIGVWDTDSFDLSRQYPVFYSEMDTKKSSPQIEITSKAKPLKNDNSGSTFDLKDFNRDYVLHDLSPTGTFYTPAQLSALRQTWSKAGDWEAKKRAMYNMGPFFIKGKVIRHNDIYWLESHDGVFTSKVKVSTGLNISMFENQTITIKGELKEYPTSIFFMSDVKLVQDASRLLPSNFSEKDGLERLKLDDKMVSANDGNGIKPDEISGIYYHGYGRTGVSGYEYHEEIRLFFKDQSVYFGDIAPSVLDKKKSQKLQPDDWGKWRKTAKGYEIQRNDDFGNPGSWENAEGRMLPKWSKGQKIDGTYNHQAFYGSMALGGTYSSTSFVFTNNGRFEIIGYNQSGSGTMAQTGSGFSAHASSYSDGKGTSSVAGGGSDGTFGGSSYAYSKNKSNDGARNRGNYQLIGTSIILTYDNGKTETLICAPWDNGLDKIIIGGVTYSKK